MQTENDTSKPEDSPKQEAGEGCSGATCSESSWTPETAVQWTPRAKKMLALARKVAIDYGQNYVGSEHLLAGIIREKEGFAARVLEAHGLTMEWLIKECGWQTMADRIEERERAEYERLRAKFDPQNVHMHAPGLWAGAVVTLRGFGGLHAMTCSVSSIGVPH